MTGSEPFVRQRDTRQRYPGGANSQIAAATGNRKNAAGGVVPAKQNLAHAGR